MIKESDQTFLNKEVIVEVCRTFQGEGKFSGKPMYLIRFDACNLVCPFCDTMIDHHHRPEKLYQEKRSILSCIDYIKNDITYYTDGFHHVNLMFTGGEPTLYNKHMKYIIETLLDITRYVRNTEDVRNAYIGTMNISVETNGHMLQEFLYYLYALNSTIHQFNIKTINYDINFSPKYMISSDQQTFFSFLNWCIEKALPQEMCDLIRKHVNVKIVYDPTFDELFKKNILDVLDRYRCLRSERVKYLPEITLMPVGTTTDEINTNMKHVVEIASKYNFNISSRLHIIHSDSILK